MIIHKSKGFTLIELSLVMSIMAILLGFISIGLVRSQQNVSLFTTEEVLATDLRQQQLKAMIGDTEGRTTSDQYGIHFDANRYVLFHGSSFSEDSSNFVNNLSSNLQFNNAGFNVIFSRVSGEISSPVIINLQDKTTSSLKRIHINSMGVITQVESL